ISAKPTDTFSADLTAQVANFGSIRTKGAINLPVTDSVFQRFAFNTVNRDGYTENVFNDTDIDGRDELSVRSSTRVEFGESADATLVLQYFKEDSDRQSSSKVACKPDPAIGCAPDTGDTIGYPADFAGSVDGGLLDPSTLIPGWPFGPILSPNRYSANPNPSDLRKVSIDIDPEFKWEESYASLEVNVDLTEELTLTSATAFVKNHYNQFRDFDLAAAPDVINTTPLTPTGELTYFFDGELQARSDYSPTQRNLRDRDEFSQEFRLTSDFSGDLNFLAGISYTKSDYHFWGVSYIPGLHNILNPAFGAGLLTGGFTNEIDFESESTAVFGEIYYDLTEDLTVTAGLRYTEDEKRSTSGANSLGHVTTFVDASGDWEEVTGKLNLSWN
ncbi:MAG: TonB-dependent receptor, partial [Pseudomonadota bacterium]|nr:TonB-dependent receptor [Pseudomonadota bacterium]